MWIVAEDCYHGNAVRDDLLFYSISDAEKYLLHADNERLMVQKLVPMSHPFIDSQGRCNICKARGELGLIPIKCEEHF